MIWQDYQSSDSIADTILDKIIQREQQSKMERKDYLQWVYDKRKKRDEDAIKKATTVFDYVQNAEHIAEWFTIHQQLNDFKDDEIENGSNRNW